MMLLFALLAWAAISLLDAVCKGRVVARYAPSTDVPWHQAPNFWSDTHPGLWKWRNVLIVISVAVLSVGAWAFGPRFAAHFASLFVLEMALYWQWIVVLGIKQKQWFGAWFKTASPPLDKLPEMILRKVDFGIGTYSQDPVYATPHFGQLPADPAWLLRPYRLLRLHRWPMIGAIVAANVLGAVIS